MKSLLLILFNAYAFILCTQINPPIIKFKSINEKWFHVSKDINNEDSNQHNVSPYWALFPTEIIVEDSSVYIIDRSRSKGSYLGPDGNLISKVNFYTGNLNWVSSNNLNSGNKYREDYFRSFTISESESISLYGFKDIDTLDTSKSIFDYYGVPVKTVFSKSTGNVIVKHYGNNKDKSDFNIIGGGNKFLLYNQNNDLLSVSQYFDDLDSLNASYVIFNKVNAELNFNNDTLYRFIKKSKVKITEPFNPFPTQVIQINPNSIAILTGENDISDFKNSPSNASISVLDISNPEDIITITEFSIKNDIYYPQDQQLPILLDTKNSDIIVYQTMRPISSPIPSNTFIWLAWYDMFGNKKSKLDVISVGNRYYRDIRLIDIKENKLYFTGYYNDGGKTGTDLLVTEEGSNTIDRIGNIELENSNDIFMFVNKTKLLPNNDIILGYNVESSDKEYQFYFCFNGSDLGLINSTKNPNSLPSFTISPNPSSSYINIETEIEYDEVFLYDFNGAVALKINGQYQVDLSNLANGTYLCELRRNGKAVSQGVKVLKAE